MTDQHVVFMTLVESYNHCTRFKNPITFKFESLDKYPFNEPYDIIHKSVYFVTNPKTVRFVERCRKTDQGDRWVRYVLLDGAQVMINEHVKVEIIGGNYE